MEVLSLGIFVADVLAKPITKMPKRGRLELIDRVELHTGGCANNTGIGLARLGISTGAMGKVGKDGFGDFILQKLRSEGVDTRGMKRDEKENTSFTFVMIAPDGERSFFHYIGTNARLSLDDIDLDIVKKVKVLHVAGSNLMPGFDGPPTARLLKKAKDFGVTTSLDTAWNSTIDWFKTMKPSLPFIDIFLPSIEEAKMITGKKEPEDIAGFLLSHGVKIVGLKMGTKGAYIATNNERHFIPTFKVKAVDATGAGDAFVAGFLTGIVKGWNVQRCGLLGSAVGACCVQAIGCTQGIKSFNETMRLMKK
ncbi:MAG: sugar kinase [Candidatus Omnitrophica bacterium]|nr:sugar kinase [Candidatus Omnitrophota bacterium]